MGALCSSCRTLGVCAFLFWIGADDGDADAVVVVVVAGRSVLVTMVAKRKMCLMRLVGMLKTVRYSACMHMKQNELAAMVRCVCWII